MKILQKQRTLDEVIVSAVETFENGCNYRLVKEADGDYLEYGCYGVHINLVTGDGALLYRWFSEEDPVQKIASLMKSKNSSRKKLTDVVIPETIAYLLAAEPCKMCGGARFSKHSAAR